MLWELAFAAEEAAEESSGRFGDVFWMFALWVIAAIIIIISFFIAGFITKIIVNRISARAKYEMNEAVLILIERVVYFGIVLLGAVIAFSIVDVNFALIIGPIGLGIGFAFKDLVANFIAGVVILTQKKFQIGALVQISDDGRIGHITEIDVRTTQVKSLDGTNLVVPNAHLLTNVVQNFTSNSFRRIAFQVGVHYSTPLPEAVKLTHKSVTSHEDVVTDPETQVLAIEFGDSAIILEVRFWIESTKAWPMIQSEVIQKLKQDFDAAGITIPFPIRTIALDEYDQQLSDALHTKNESSKKPVHQPGFLEKVTEKPKKETKVV